MAIPWLLGDKVSLSDPFKTLGGGGPPLLQANSATHPSLKFHINVSFAIAIQTTTKVKLQYEIPFIPHLTITTNTVVHLNFHQPNIKRFPLTVTTTTHSNFQFGDVAPPLTFALDATVETVTPINFSVYASPFTDSNFLNEDTFLSGLPTSLIDDPNVQTFAQVMDKRLTTLLNLVGQIQVLSNLEMQPEVVIDILAFQFGVLFYNSTFTITDPAQRLAAKKALVANAYGILRQLGTITIMQQIVTALYQPAIIQTWNQYGGTHDHYRVLTENTINDSAVIALLSSTLFVIQRASQTFDGFFTFVGAGIPTAFYVPAAYVEYEIVTPIARAA